MSTNLKAAPVSQHNANSPSMLVQLTLFMLVFLGGSLALMHILH
jgi:hypothetical protein